MPRSIPACAGNPRGGELRLHPCAVHPRVCGEPTPYADLGIMIKGPSPRVRGTPRPSVRFHDGAGSIPACAGNPSWCCPARGRRAVHPRVCGEPRHGPRSGRSDHGPSPRVRGTRSRTPARRDASRSIPACAGNPRARGGTCTPIRVHPRVCGEPRPAGGHGRKPTGPSPRVRGTRDQTERRPAGDGSIPACAGNPLRAHPSARRRRVHPRVCGEPGIMARVGSGAEGPSPRVRGTRVRVRAAIAVSGSIPACAGNPSSWPPTTATPRVHPRVCGEPVREIATMAGMTGPSPRVRGTPVGGVL